MPAPTRFHPDAILEEAFKIAQRQGMHGLTARGIAQQLGCSTQPVYSAFGSMEKLRTAIEKKAYAFFVDYLLEEQMADEPFLSMGLRYFRFARKEQMLFRTFFLEGEMALNVDKIRRLAAPLAQRMKDDPHLRNLSEEQMDRIGSDMWVYTHGLAALTYRSEDPDIETYVLGKLSHMGDTVIEWEHQRAGSSPDGR